LVAGGPHVAMAAFPPVDRNCGGLMMPVVQPSMVCGQHVVIGFSPPQAHHVPHFSYADHPPPDGRVLWMFRFSGLLLRRIFCR